MSKVSTDETEFYKIYERVAEGGIRATLGEGERLLKDDILNRPGSGTITADTEYAEALEKGTERMAARPYFGKLENDYAPQLEAAFRSGAGE